jgi:formylglycine-generating enzyme required for sulfatase activity
VKGATGVYSGQEYIYLSYLSDYPDATCWIKYAGGTFTVETGKENYPVVWVTWYGSKAFALYYGLDLPTEAELEYACRGGKQYKYGTDDGTLSTSKANYWDNGVHHPVDVGSYPANPFGLYDMSGNVWEWCHDWYGIYPSGSVTNPTGALSGSYRVTRGGGWLYDGSYCRSADRGGGNPGGGYYHVGFRVVRRVSP